MRAEQSAFSLVRLSSLVDINIGKTPARKENTYWKGIYPWVSIRDMKGDRYIQVTKERITDEGVAKSGIKIVSPNTILFSYKLSIGKVAITKTPMFTNEAIAAFPIRDTSKVDLLYLYYALREMDFTGGGDRAVMGMTLNKAKLKELQIPLPPLEEQKKIAAILDAADKLRQKDAQLIEKYNALSQSLFLDMFGDPVTNPMGWEEITLESAAANIKNAIVDGPFGSSIKQHDYVDEGIPIIRINNIRNEGYHDDDYKFLSREKFEELSRSKVSFNDLLIARVGNTIGKTCIFNQQFEALLSTTGVAKATIDSNKFSIYFINTMMSLRTYKQHIQRQVQGAGQPYLNLSKIKGFTVINVPLELQNQFAERIQTIEAQKQQAKASLQKSEELFNSLLQRAFKGELTA